MELSCSNIKTISYISKDGNPKKVSYIFGK